MTTSFAACGLVVGHATDVDGATGCTVVRGETGAFRCAMHVMGRATGTRETALLEPGQLVDRVDAILLAGGSAYGLDAAGGVMRWMEERDRGFSVGAGVVPIVPGAVVFDLAPLGRFDARPTPAMGYAACEAATAEPQEGSVGAGTGATVGKVLGPAGAMKGGLGTGSADAGRLTVRALAVVNALGDVRDASGQIVAGARDAQGRYVNSAAYVARGPAETPRFDALAGRNTTLCVLATNAALDRVQLASVARAAAAALYRRITPVGTMFDGDVIFATSPAEGGVAAAPPQVEALAVLALEQAIERSVRTRAPGDVLS
ncbi:MAG: P1 family peptidase [Gemmatimonadaceae bacterium]|nr:P1 family peptidase [Gemmatimonadaceae bacterium]NUR33115.1 P1 family peptidase [Gemmatimonadaceae bacterium]NUS31484.1 P1 family peptidase [Gemmatimonadaceae bacterium]